MNAATIVNERSHQRHLNFDILVYVGRSIAGRNDLLSFISTCSDLYRTGVPTLLGFPYHINERNLAAFYAFLVSRSPSSFLGLRDLDLYLPDIGPNDTTIITDILSRAKKLRSIGIHGSVTMPDPAVYRALVALPTLENLDLQMCSDSKAVLAQLRSPVLSLLLRFNDDEEDIVTMLSNFAHTLEDLTVYTVVLCKTTSINFHYRNVTSLMLCFVPALQLSILIPAFPNLESLYVTNADGCLNPEIVRWHADNLLFQQEHHDQTWRLSSLTGDVASLYTLGLQTTVPTVTVTRLDVEDSDDNGLLKAVLTPLRPLSLAVTPGPYDPVFTTNWLSDEVADECCELVRLDLELTFENTMLDHEHQRRLGGLFGELHLLSESHPNLAFLCINISDEDCHLRLPAFNAFVETLDMRQLATLAFLTVPTLKMTKIMTFPAHSEESMSYWIYQDDGELTEVPEECHAATEDDLNKKTQSLIEEACTRMRPGSR